MHVVCQRVAVAFLAVTSVAIHAGAYTPPHTSVAEALESGQIAFIGRIARLEEIEHDVHGLSRGIATVTVLHALYGLEVDEGDSVTVEYLSRAFYWGPILPLGLELSEIVLFVLNSPSETGSNYAFIFDSAWQDGIDLAYYICNEPEEEFARTERIYMVSAYGPGWNGRVDRQQLFALAKMRTKELAGEAKE